MDEGLQDREHMPGRGELLQVLRQRSVEPLPPGPVARHGETADAAGQGLRLGDEHVESRQFHVVGQPEQELLPVAELLARVGVGGLHIQIRQILPQALGLPAVQPAQPHRVHGGRLRAFERVRAGRIVRWPRGIHEAPRFRKPMGDTAPGSGTSVQQHNLAHHEYPFE
jgi:hypothetical protein